MSVCAPCTKVRKIPRCLTNLIVGMGSVSTSYFVFIRNIATGHITRYSVVSSVTGLITVVLGDLQLTDELEYELWVTLQSSTNVDARETILINLEPVTCVVFTTLSVADDDNNQVTYTNVQFQLE